MDYETAAGLAGWDEEYTEPEPEPRRRFCDECGCQLTEQECHVCLHCARIRESEPF